MSIKIIAGDARRELKKLAANSVDFCLTDPPYEIGFMGNAWDKQGVAFDTQLWREVKRVLKPGAMVLSFGHTRTWHRLSSALDAAGLIVADTPLAWVHAQGLPKSLNISKLFDRKGGTAAQFAPAPCWQVGDPIGKTGLSVGDTDPYSGKQIRGIKRGHETIVDTCTPYAFATNTSQPGFAQEWMSDPAAILSYHLDLQPVTVAGAQWDGYGTALKPAWEPIVCARKPGSVVPDIEFPPFIFAKKASVSERVVGVDNTRHPTVKPLKLIQELLTGASQVLQYRFTVLDPFAGSGTTLEAAANLQLDGIGIELKPSYVPLIEQRIARAEKTQ